MRQQQPGADRPGRRGGHRGRRRPAAAGQPQVDDEHARDQLDRGGQPDQGAPRPARRPGRAVGHGQGQQHHVHLAEPDLIPQREQVGAGREHDRGQHHPHPAGPAQQRRERVADHHGERRVDERHPGQLRGRPRQQGQRHREQRRGRRVGEREQLRRLGQDRVQRLALQHAQTASAVDVEVHQPLVGHAGQVAAHQRLDGGQRRDPGQHAEGGHRPGRQPGQPPQPAGPARPRLPGGWPAPRPGPR